MAPHSIPSSATEEVQQSLLESDIEANATVHIKKDCSCPGTPGPWEWQWIFRMPMALVIGKEIVLNELVRKSRKHVRLKAKDVK